MKYLTLRQLLVVSSLSSLIGCGLIGNFQNIYFYPMKTSSQTHSFKGTIYNVSGKIKLTSSSGDQYEGTLFSISRPEDSSDPLYLTELGFPKNWNMVYGDNFYSKNVLGSNRYFRSKLVSSSGAYVYVEIVRPNPKSDERIGVAIDSNRDVYKITF